VKTAVLLAVAVGLGVLLRSVPGQAQGPAAALGLAHPASIGRVPHSAKPFDIDGVLDDPIWADALVVQLGIETNPAENQPAPVHTEAYIVEDGAALLVAFDAMDPDPTAIRAYLRDRDSAFNDDFVGVVVDTFNDERRAFEFFANALGVQMDLTNDDVNGGEDASWDAIWDSAGAVNGGGYTVEMSIPFSQLRFPADDGEQTWGIDVLRFYPRGDRMRLSVNPLERGRNCYLCQLGKVQGFENAEPGLDLEVVPSVTAARTDVRDEAEGALRAGDTHTELGLDVSWGILPNMTANLALNPDFSQVEADVAQLDVNNRFALFFPETRPFFLDGADYFATPINAVFTRTVADPDIGAKLTGALGDNTFGAFVAEDAVTNLLFPGPLGSSNDTLDRASRAAVARYRRSVGKASTLGALVTSRSASGYRNTLAGVDGRMRVGDRHSITFQYLDSRTEYPSDLAAGFGQPQGAFGGDALRLEYAYSSRNWFVNARKQAVEPGFRADLGFVTRVDVDQQNFGFGRIWQGGADNWWNRLQLGMNVNAAHDFEGRLLGRGKNLFFAMQGPLQSFVQAGRSSSRQFWDGRDFDLDGVFMFGQVRPRGGLNLSLEVNAGDSIDYANSRLAHELRLAPALDWNVNRHALLRVRHTADRLETPAGEKILDADLTDLRLTWQFNLRSFLRLTVQRQFVERNLAAFENPATEPKSLTVGTQLLYSYQLNPQSVLYAGYSDNRLQNRALPDLAPTERTVFLKFSYAWAP
jgi:hypothetical protein